MRCDLRRACPLRCRPRLNMMPYAVGVFTPKKRLDHPVGTDRRTGLHHQGVDGQRYPCCRFILLPIFPVAHVNNGIIPFSLLQRLKNLGRHSNIKSQNPFIVKVFPFQVPYAMSQPPSLRPFNCKFHSSKPQNIPQTRWLGFLAVLVHLDSYSLRTQLGGPRYSDIRGLLEGDF